MCTQKLVLKSSWEFIHNSSKLEIIAEWTYKFSCYPYNGTAQ